MSAAEQQSVLPNRVYQDEAHLELERHAVFGANWIGVALEDDVPRPGTVFPVNAAGEPLLVSRDAQGRLAVFHNVCSHRGTCLVTQAGARHQLICPYHGWVYGLDGTLQRTPGFAHPHSDAPQGLDLQELALKRVRFDVWNRVIFVNMSTDALALEQRMATLSQRWHYVDLNKLALGPEVTYVVDANWKLVTENFLESYHLPNVHRSLNQYSSLDDHEVIVEGDSHFGQRSARYVPNDEASAVLPTFPGLSEAQRLRAEYLCVFPSTWVSLTADHFRVSFINPLSPTRTQIRWMFLFQSDIASSPEIDKARQLLAQRVLSVFEEDVPILERMQIGRRSRAFNGGYLSPHHEGAVRRFQQLISKACGGLT